MKATLIHQNKWVPLDTEEDDPVIASGGVSARDYLRQKLADPARAARVSAFRKDVGQHLAAKRQGRETLTTLRMQAGLSQAALAAKIGTQQPNIARLEKSPMGVQLETLMRLANAFGLDVGQVADVVAKQITAPADNTKVAS